MMSYGEKERFVVEVDGTRKVYVCTKTKAANVPTYKLERYDGSDMIEMERFDVDNGLVTSEIQKRISFYEGVVTEEIRRARV